jgi:hypothetical protein
MIASPFVRFMVSPAGRIARVAAGAALLGWGLTNRSSAAGVGAAAFSVVPLAAGAFDLCPVGAVLGAPFSGPEARARLGANR